MKKQEKEPFLDRVLLHSKNADERLFDMVLRFITFVILIIIIWIYADLAHVKADNNIITNDDIEFTTLQNYTGLTASEVIMNSSDCSDYLNSINIDTSYVNLGAMPSTYQSLIDSQSYITEEFLNNLPIPISASKQNVDANGARWNVDFNMDNCDISVRYRSITSEQFIYDVYFIQPEQFMISLNDRMYNTTGDYSWNNKFGFRFYVTFIYTVSSGNFSASIGGDRYDSSFGSINLFSDAPIYSGYGLANNIVTNFINNDYQEILDNKNSYVVNVNYVNALDLLNPAEQKESDSNHLYLKDFNVCLTPADSFIDSSVVITMSWDEWIEKYIDNYYVDIYYSLDYNGEPWSRIDTDPPVNNPMNYTVVYENIPLTKFRSYYQEDISTILGSMYINHESALAMMNALNAAGAFTYTSNGTLTFQDVINGTSAEFSINKGAGGSVNLGVLYSYLYQTLSPLHAGETTVFIDQFEFTVEFDIYSKTVQEESMLGGRTFDLLNGTSNTNYNILNNQNPWSGSTTEGKSEKTGGTYYGENTNIAYGGSASAQGGNANVGNITITTGNGYKDTELHQLTNQDIVHNHQKIITVIEDLKYCFHQFAQESNHNSFIQMIYDDYNYIPGIEYITTSIIIICGVCVLIFIIKIAF